MLLDSPEALCEACKKCLLPALQSDIGSDLLDSKHFNSFRVQLNENLHKIFDAINVTQIFAGDLLTPEVRQNLVILYCEQTASHAEYKTDQKMLEHCLEALRSRIDVWLSEQETWQKSLGWYKTRVTINGWKRNLGATHGLARLCEVVLKRDISQSLQLSIDDSLFMLSAGTLLLEHFEHVYKEFGLTIFLALLRNISKEDLATTNLQDPIFDICVQNVSIIKDLQINRQLWSCLITCLALKPSCQTVIPSKWCHRDDVASALLNRLAFESDYHIRLLLMRCIPSVFAPSQPINLLIATDQETAQIDYRQLREDSKVRPCLAACRWTKKLVKIWIYHVSCSFGPSADVALNLRVVHVCYLLCFFGMPLTMVRNELREVLDEIPEHLVQLVQHNDRNEIIVKEIHELLLTMEEHLKVGNSSNKLSPDENTFFYERGVTLRRLRAAIP